MKLVENNYQELQALMSELSCGEDRLEFFVDQARNAEVLPQDYRIDSFRVRGCISNLWIVPSYEAGCCSFLVDGDAVIPKGVAVTILELFQGASPEDIVRFDKSRLRELGIAEVLSPNRRNALSHVCDAVLYFALSVLEAEQPRFATA